MKKIVLLLILSLAAIVVSFDQTYAYVFTDDYNAIASDSPYAITYTTDYYNDDYQYVHIKIAPTPGYTFYGNFVITFFNIYDDPRLAPYDTVYQDGFISEFIPNLVSPTYVRHFNSNDEVRDLERIAFYQGDPSRIMIRFNNIAAEDDYYVFTVLLSTDYTASSYVSSLMNTANDYLVRFSMISPEEYDVIYDQGYADALAQIQAEYDLLVTEIIDVQEENQLLSSQIDDYVTGDISTDMTATDFISENVGYILLSAIALIALGMSLGSKKKRKYKKYY